MDKGGDGDTHHPSEGEKGDKESTDDMFQHKRSRISRQNLEQASQGDPCLHHQVPQHDHSAYHQATQKELAPEHQSSQGKPPSDHRASQESPLHHHATQDDPSCHKHASQGDPSPHHPDSQDTQHNTSSEESAKVYFLFVSPVSLLIKSYAALPEGQR